MGIRHILMFRHHSLHICYGLNIFCDMQFILQVSSYLYKIQYLFKGEGWIEIHSGNQESGRKKGEDKVRITSGKDVWYYL